MKNINTKTQSTNNYAGTIRISINSFGHNKEIVYRYDKNAEANCCTPCYASQIRNTLSNEIFTLQDLTMLKKLACVLARETDKVINKRKESRAQHDDLLRALLAAKEELKAAHLAYDEQNLRAKKAYNEVRRLETELATFHDEKTKNEDCVIKENMKYEKPTDMSSTTEKIQKEPKTENFKKDRNTEDKKCKSKLAAKEFAKDPVFKYINDLFGLYTTDD